MATDNNFFNIYSNIIIYHPPNRIEAAQEKAGQTTEAARHWKSRFSELRNENPVLAGEISRLQKVKRQLIEEVASL
jgi:hypothetical protein